MKMKKINAALGLLSIAAMLVHIGYTVFAYLTFYYNESLKILTAIPFMVLVCLHAVCGRLFIKDNGRKVYFMEETTACGWECSCLQGICGACAMVINGKPALACEAFLRDLKHGKTVDDNRFYCLDLPRRNMSMQWNRGAL